MGDLAKLGWQRMDALVQAHEADGVLHMICDQVADKVTLSDISRAEGIPYSVLWKWLSADGRMEAYRSALEARADAEVHETLAIADGATVEDVGVAKLRVETRKWAASKWDRKVYGDGNGMGGGGFGGVTVIIGDVGVGRIVGGSIVEGTEDRLVEVAEGST